MGSNAVQFRTCIYVLLHQLQMVYLAGFVLTYFLQAVEIMLNKGTYTLNDPLRALASLLIERGSDFDHRLYVGMTDGSGITY